MSVEPSWGNPARWRLQAIASFPSLIVGVFLAGGSDSLTAENSFTEQRLSSEYHGEGAAFGDFNHDGLTDLASGPFWYSGPDFETAQAFYPPNPKDANKNGYTNDNFLVFAEDLNRDDWDDILVVGFPGTPAHWYENPRGGSEHWKKHLVLKQVGNESPLLAPLNQEGPSELVCISDGKFGYAEQSPDAPTKPWTFNAISETSPAGPFTHGLGVGDINGDERPDVLTKDGWFQQPEDITHGKAWAFHRFEWIPSRRVPFPGGAQIYAYDVDGDHDSDLIMSLSAHAYGLAWFEQTVLNGKTVFRQHTLMNQSGESAEGEPLFSQLHAVQLADLDGDGLKDIITGKCRFAHGPAGDPDPQGDPVLYCFKLQRQAQGVSFAPQKISATAGVGRQIAIADANQDGRLDIAIGNKVGTTLLSQ